MNSFVGIFQWLCLTLASAGNIAEQIFSRAAAFRSSRPEVFRKKVVLRNFAKFKEKHLCYSLSGIGVFREFCEISKNNFSYRRPPVAASVF